MRAVEYGMRKVRGVLYWANLSVFLSAGENQRTTLFLWAMHAALA